MGQSRLLHLSARGLTAWHWSHHQLHRKGAFTADEAGAAAFDDYLRSQHERPHHLLVDLADEAFLTEDIPYVKGGDRKAMVRRKLAQHFRHRPLSAAFSLGRNPEGRRDEKVLFAALAEPARLEPWLAALRRAETPLAGIYSVAQLLSVLATDAPGRLLLVTLANGLRQTYLKDGRLHFSRVTQLPGQPQGEAIDGEATATAIRLESDRMFQHLLGQHLIARGETLNVLVLGPSDMEAALRRRWTDSDELRFDFLDIEAVGRRLGLNLSAVPAGDRAEALVLHLLATARPRQQFAPPAERQLFRLWQIKRGLLAAGAALLFGSLLFAAVRAIDYEDARKRIGEHQAGLNEAHRRHDEVIASVPPVTMGQGPLGELVGRYDRLRRATMEPEPVLLALGRALNDTPAVEIDRIDWQLSGEALGIGGDKIAGTEVVGRLPPYMAADHRAQIAVLQDFSTRLQRDPELSIKVAVALADDDAARTLTSSDPPTDDAPRFSLRISLAR